MNTFEDCDNCHNVSRYENKHKCIICGKEFVPLNSWIEITDDPNTLPPNNERVLVFYLSTQFKWQTGIGTSIGNTHKGVWLIDGYKRVNGNTRIITHWKPLIEIGLPNLSKATGKLAISKSKIS